MKASSIEAFNFDLFKEVKLEVFFILIPRLIIVPEPFVVNNSARRLSGEAMMYTASFNLSSAKCLTKSINCLCPEEISLESIFLSKLSTFTKDNLLPPIDRPPDGCKKITLLGPNSVTSLFRFILPCGSVISSIVIFPLRAF